MADFLKRTFNFGKGKSQSKTKTEAQAPTGKDSTSSNLNDSQKYRDDPRFTPLGGGSILTPKPSGVSKNSTQNVVSSGTSGVYIGQANGAAVSSSSSIGSSTVRKKAPSERGKYDEVMEDNGSVNSVVTELTQLESRCMAANGDYRGITGASPVPANLRRNLTVDSFGSAMKSDVSDILSVSTIMTSEVVPTSAAARVAENVISVLFAGKTKRGQTPHNPRKPNQDSFMMKHDPATSSLVIACFDGHGQYGHDVSRYCRAYMEKNLITHPLFNSDVKTAIMETSASLEKDMLASPHVDTVFSGTTMALMVLRGTTVYVANLGDSRVVLGHSKGPKKVEEPSPSTAGTTPEDLSDIGEIQSTGALTSRSVTATDRETPSLETARKDSAGKLFAGNKNSGESGGGNSNSNSNSAAVSSKERESGKGARFSAPKTIALSIDHKPNLPKEMERIVGSGGRVKIVHETARVYLATDDIPGLAMSRSFGDFVAHNVGVIGIPEVFEYDLSALMGISSPEIGPDGRPSASTSICRSVLVLATDGLFDMMPNDHVVHMAFKHWGDPAAAAEAIVAYTGQKWMSTWGLADDTTVCIVNLEHSGFV